MPRHATIVVAPTYLNNRIFSHDPAINRDGCLTAYHALQKAFLDKDVILQTQDLTPVQEADLVLYMDMPATLPTPAQKSKSHLLIGEVPAVMPTNWILSKHNAFAKIFTFCDDYVDNKKYFKLNSARSFSPHVPTRLEEKTGFCTLISGNKFSSHPAELYSKRREAIRWFEAHHPEHFQLYGIGWNRKVFTGLLRPLNRIRPVGEYLAPSYPSYRGTLNNKAATLSRYKFTIAFENARGIPGYVTGDKIFDPMQSGSIPIYWGAPNITQYVPAECFIDFRDFNCSWNELYPYLAKLSPAEHKKYLNNIKDYIVNVAPTGTHSSATFAQTLVQQTL